MVVVVVGLFGGREMAVDCYIDCGSSNGGGVVWLAVWRWGGSSRLQQAVLFCLCSSLPVGVFEIRLGFF